MHASGKKTNTMNQLVCRIMKSYVLIILFIFIDNTTCKSH